MYTYPINGSLVNTDGSNYSGSAFTSRVLPQTVNPNVLPEPLNKVQAANSYIPCQKGGKIQKKKIKNISNMYKMTKRQSKTWKKKLMSFLSKKNKRHSKRKNTTKSRRTKSRKTRTRQQKGGYSQYQNNMPMTPTYSLGGKLSPNMSALANPPPQHRLSNCTNCVDNYSRFTNAGFPSKGWW